MVIASVTLMSFGLSSTATTFHYDSESTLPGAFANPNNWKEGSSPIACNTGETKPCQISAIDVDELQDMLSGKNNNDVLEIVESTRD